MSDQKLGVFLMLCLYTDDEHDFIFPKNIK